MTPATPGDSLVAETPLVLDESRGPVRAPGRETLIEKREGRVGFGLGDLWDRRELLFFLAWRDVKVRYKQTLLGVAWALLQPLCAMLIFSLVFGRLARMPSDGVPYALFCTAALVPWLYFSSAVSQAGNSLIASADFITKVYFPRVLIPTASVLSGLCDLFMGSLLLIGLAAWHGVHPGLSLLGAIPLAGLMVLTAWGAGIWLSALNVRYRDVRHTIPFLLQVWMFATPVVYPASLVPEGRRWLMGLNPMAGVVEGMRSALFGTPWPWGLLAVSATVSVGLALGGLLVFRRMEPGFADVI